MPTDDEMLQARILALKKAKAALKLEVGIIVKCRALPNRLFNSEEGQGLSPSQKCATKDYPGRTCICSSWDYVSPTLWGLSNL